MFRFAISYKDHSVADKFLRGTNVEAKDIKKAIKEFETSHPNCDIVGILKSDIQC